MFNTDVTIFVTLNRLSVYLIEKAWCQFIKQITLGILATSINWKYLVVGILNLHYKFLIV